MIHDYSEYADFFSQYRTAKGADANSAGSNTGMTGSEIIIPMTNEETGRTHEPDISQRADIISLQIKAALAAQRDPNVQSTDINPSLGVKTVKYLDGSSAVLPMTDEDFARITGGNPGLLPQDQRFQAAPAPINSYALETAKIAEPNLHEIYYNMPEGTKIIKYKDGSTAEKPMTPEDYKRICGIDIAPHTESTSNPAESETDEKFRKLYNQYFG